MISLFKILLRVMFANRLFLVKYWVVDLIVKFIDELITLTTQFFIIFLKGYVKKVLLYNFAHYEVTLLSPL